MTEFDLIFSSGKNVGQKTVSNICALQIIVVYLFFNPLSTKKQMTKVTSANYKKM